MEVLLFGKIQNKDLKLWLCWFTAVQLARIEMCALCRDGIPIIVELALLLWK